MKKYFIVFLFLLGIIISIPTLLPLFNNNFFQVHDNTQIERVFEIKKSLNDGLFPVRWTDDLGYGYGYPIFNFYAPLPYYIGGIANLIANNSLISTQIMFGIGLMLSFFTMYLFAAKLTNRWGGIIAGIIYLYFPYHAVNVYIRGAVGEFFAYAFTPLVFLGAFFISEKIGKTQKISYLWTIFTAVSITLVIISHNLSAYMLMLFLAPYILYLIFSNDNKKTLVINFALTFLLAFVLSAFYLLPAVFESRFTNVSSQVGGGADYPDHFVCPSQLWSSEWGFGGSIPGCIDGLSFRIGKINVLLTVFAFIFFLYSLFKKSKTQESIFWAFLIFSIFLLLPYSKFIWDNMPFMEYLQFPWRFLNFVALFISILSAFFIYKISSLRFRISAVVVVGILTIWFNYKLFTPVVFINEQNSYFEDQTHIRWETSKISDEYMPQHFDKPDNEEELPEDLVYSIDENIKIGQIFSQTGYIEFEKNGPEGKIYINKAYFPSWQGYINEKKTSINREARGMSVALPKGELNIKLKFQNTTVQRIGNILSIIGIVSILIAIIAKRKKLYE